MLKVGFHAGQPFVHAEHLPVKAAKCGEDRQQQGAVESSVIHAAQTITAKKSASMVSFLAKRIEIAGFVALRTEFNH
ncbi:MAG: hypothetical protein OXI74_05630 [Rhodospirillaceae bacterium]|nr:hypothetical protein [Rhodospirillaceae bacterium]